MRDRQTSSRAPPINQQKSSEHYFSNDSQAQVHLGELPIASIQEKHLPPSGENAAEENLEGYLPDLPRGVPWVPQETKVCHSYLIQAKSHQHGGKASMRCALTATGSSQHRFRLQQNLGCKTQSQVANTNDNIFADAQRALAADLIQGLSAIGYEIGGKAEGVLSKLSSKYNSQ